MPATHEELVALWGEDGVVVVEAADELPVTRDVRTFLSQVGLPRFLRYFFTADPAELNLPGPGWSVVSGRAQPPPAVYHDSLRLGWNYAGDEIRLEYASGAVAEHHADARGATMVPINSSVEQFVTSLIGLGRLQRIITGASPDEIGPAGSGPQLSDAEIDAREEQFAQELKQIDPGALAKPGSWWAALIEQMRAGIL